MNYFSGILQFLKYAAVGAVGTLAQFIILISLVYLVVLNAVAASTIGYLIGALINYYLNFLYTFKSKQRHRRALPLFLIIALVGLIFNSSLMFICTHYLGIHYLISQILATGAVLIWTFFANRMWTFRATRSEIL